MAIVICWNCGKAFTEEEVTVKEYMPRDLSLTIYPDQEPVEVYKECPDCGVSLPD